MDEKNGCRYLSHISLNAQNLLLPDSALSIKSGMNVVTEVKTEKRNIYGCFIRPIRESIYDSFKER